MSSSILAELEDALRCDMDIIFMEYDIYPTEAYRVEQLRLEIMKAIHKEFTTARNKIMQPKPVGK